MNIMCIKKSNPDLDNRQSTSYPQDIFLKTFILSHKKYLSTENTVHSNNKNKNIYMFRIEGKCQKCSQRFFFDCSSVDQTYMAYVVLSNQTQKHCVDKNSVFNLKNQNVEISEDHLGKIQFKIMPFVNRQPIIVQGKGGYTEKESTKSKIFSKNNILTWLVYVVIYSGFFVANRPGLGFFYYALSTTPTCALLMLVIYSYFHKI